MSKQPRITISEDDRLKALALATIGNQKYREAVEFERQMQALLGLPPYAGDSFTAELIYSDDNFTVAKFDAGLARDRVAVASADPLGRETEAIET